MKIARPTNRIDALFEGLRRKNRAGLIVYLTAGYPSMDATRAMLPALEEAGADLVELGVPFSDPMADGPVIQQACARALDAGFRLDALFDAVQSFRSVSRMPLVLFSYYNVLFRRGVPEMARVSAGAGIDGWLLVDVPAEEAGEVAGPLAAHGLHRIPLVAPTTAPQRLPAVLAGAGGFVYYITVKGVTGARRSLPPDLVARLADVRKRVSLPVAAGFGIGDAAAAGEIGRHADAVVVGSRIVQALGEGGTVHEGLHAASGLVRRLAGALAIRARR